jgi:hypothetical protein
MDQDERQLVEMLEYCHEFADRMLRDSRDVPPVRRDRQS